MITYDFIKECLEILDLKYTELDDGGVAVSFFDEEFFKYQVVTFIRINEEQTFLTFSSRAFEYHPEGDLLAMANRHNCRCHAPCCHIDEDGDIVFDRSYTLKSEVSPHYILNNVLRPSIFLPLESFVNFELTDEEIEAKNNN